MTEKPAEEFASIQPEGGKKVEVPAKIAAETPKPPILEKRMINEIPTPPPKKAEEQPSLTKPLIHKDAPARAQ